MGLKPLTTPKEEKASQKPIQWGVMRLFLLSEILNRKGKRISERTNN